MAFDDHDFTKYLDFGDSPASDSLTETDDASQMPLLPGQFSLPGDPGAASLAAGEQGGIPQLPGRFSLPGEDLSSIPYSAITSATDNGQDMAAPVQLGDYHNRPDYKVQSKNSIVTKFKNSLNSLPKMAENKPISISQDSSSVPTANPLADRQAQLDAALADREQNMRNSVLRAAGTGFLNADRTLRGQAHMGPSESDQRLMRMEDLKLKDLNENLALAGKVSEEEKSKMQLQNIAALNDPNSPQTQAMKQGLKQLFGDRISPETLDKMTGSQLQALDKDLGGIFTKIDDRKFREQEAKERREDRNLDRKVKLAQIQSTKDLKEIAKQDKADEKDIKRLDTANKLITSEVASGRSAFGVAAKNLQSIGNVKALLEGALDPNDLDTRQVYELAKSLDRILSQSGGTISGTEHLTPDTARSRLSKLIEYVTNKRQGAQAGSFVENMSHAFDREEKQAKHQINSASKALLSSYLDLKDKPRTKDLWDAMILNHGLNPDDFEKGAAGLIKQEKSYSPKQEQGIENVMKANGISREKAIDALKKAGKL